jgi:hypothetical protein
MEFIRRKCLSPRCPAMACPSATGHCSFHDLERTPLGQRPEASALPHVPKGLPDLQHAQPISQMVQ